MIHGYADLQRADPRNLIYMRYPGPWACVVDAVYHDKQGILRVDVTTIRQGAPFKFCYCQTPNPQVGDRGFVDFIDGRREMPFYVGIRQAFFPLVVTVQTVSGSTVSVVAEDGTTFSNVPYVTITLTGTDSHGDTITLTGKPQVGDVGLLSTVSGDASRLVYSGPLSAVP
jgi:hypothetical protein